MCCMKMPFSYQTLLCTKIFNKNHICDFTIYQLQSSLRRSSTNQSQSQKRPPKIEVGTLSIHIFDPKCDHKIVALDRDIGIIFYSLLLRKVVITAGPQYTIKYCVPVNDLMPCQSQVLFDLTAACVYWCTLCGQIKKKLPVGNDERLIWKKSNCIV